MAITIQNSKLKTQNSTWKMMRKEWTAYLFLLPSLLQFAVLLAFPVIFSFYLSFHEWNILEPEKPFVGLENYARLLTDRRVHQAIWNTIYYTVVSVPLTLFCGLLVALLLNNQIRARGLFRTFFYLPVITPLVIASIIWKWVYNGDYGLANYYLLKLNIIDEPLLWLADKNLAMPSVIITSVWKSVGFAMVVYLAGLQAIPEEYYDAAKIDGAGALRRFRDITLPLLSPTTFLVIILSVIGSFLAFTQFFILTQGGPGRETTPIVLYIYQRAFVQLQVGAATAASIILIIVVAAVSALQFRLLRSEH